MRLLQFGPRNELTLTSYDEDKLPPYAILSHTWGAEDEEVTYQDISHGAGKSKAGHAKIMFCGLQALRDDLKHFWVDTCCIDKPNSTELSEALNRTLQELIAPQIVEFWSRDGDFLGTKHTLTDLISELTKIPPDALTGRSPLEYSKNERFRWAANRETKKREDRAYSLLGLFDVYLPFIYGEGDHAFSRLEREIDQKLQRLSPKANTQRLGGIPPVNAEEKRQSLLDSLSFEQMDSRRFTIKDAESNTCKWILQDPRYIAWSDNQISMHGQAILWVAGKPGTGKSTMMKFVHSHAKRLRGQNEIILSFFFNARGDDFEKTTTGMYRALLFQLLTAVPETQTVLDDVAVSSSGPLELFDWTLDTLQDVLCNAVATLGDRRLRCFLDALDECDEQQIRDMIEFLERIAHILCQSEGHLHLCFASRHYPTIVLHEGLRLVLEDQPGHVEDLQTYISRRLKAGCSKQVSSIRAQVQEKARGVFLWVVLVIDILNAEFRRGRIFAVKQRLQELPVGLKELFKDLLRRDRVNMEDLLLCIQWVLFAKRPLTRAEFYFAMNAGLHDTGHVEGWQAEPWHPDEVTDDDMKRFVLNSSKGLAELTRSSRNPTVQFIHETVRDFLLKDRGIYDLWPELDGKLASRSHDRLKMCCISYMSLRVSHVYLPEPLPKASSQEAKDLRQSVSAKFPFLGYATDYVLDHANEASRCVGQESFVKAFALDRWIHLTNLFEHFEIRRHSPRTTWSYILAEKNLARLLEMVDKSDLWLRSEDNRYQFSAAAAFANGHLDALRVFLGDGDPTLLDDIVKDPGFGQPAEVRMVKTYSYGL